MFGEHLAQLEVLVGRRSPAGGNQPSGSRELEAQYGNARKHDRGRHGGIRHPAHCAEAHQHATLPKQNRCRDQQRQPAGRRATEGVQALRPAALRRINMRAGGYRLEATEAPRERRAADRERGQRERAERHQRREQRVHQPPPAARSWLDRNGRRARSRRD